jgi:hypothetical protein
VRLVAPVLAVLLVGVCAAACGDHRDGPTLSWNAHDLPVPPGSRAMPRAATWCDGRWVVVGSTADAAGLTRATVWTSRDAVTWKQLTLHPGRDYYAARAILTSVGCSRGRLAVLGAKSGGVHGTPRIRTWTQRPDGSLAAVTTSYLLFGGTQAVDASRLEGGPRGYLVAGTRTSGAAVWTSRTGTDFRLHAGESGLADTPVTHTQAVDAVAGPAGLLVVGTTTDKLGQLFATAWTRTEPDHWDRLTLPGRHTVSTADLVIPAGSGGRTIVAGVLDQQFGLWVGRRGAWLLDGTFGKRDTDGTSAPYISGLALAGGRVLVTYSDGTRFGLAVLGGGDAGTPPLPTPVTVDGTRAVTVATHGSDALLLTDDGALGRTWLAHVPAP